MSGPRPPATRFMHSEAGAARRALTDIRHHIILAQGFVQGLEYGAFKDDILRLYAVTRCLEVISEASRRLPEATKSRHPGIAWRAMAAAGNVYRHEYENVAAGVVWRTLTVDATALLDVVECELAALDKTL